MFDWKPEDLKNIELLKIKGAYISKTETELKTNHPATIPNLLLSNFSQDLIKNPVISDKGRVYDKKEIEKWLETHTTDEFREPLTIDELHPFPELEKIIEDYKILSNKFILVKKSLVDRARNMAAQSTAEIPEIFICPISQKLIDHPVISNLGVVYDKVSFRNRPKDNLNALETVVAFTEFEQYLNFYCWKWEQSQQNLADNSLNKTENQSFIRYISQSVHSFSNLFFSLMKPTENENQNKVNEGTNQPASKLV
jgi:hypothetical protein